MKLWLQKLLHERKCGKIVTGRTFYDPMYMNHEVQIIAKKRLNHNVEQFHLEKPAGYEFIAGQAIELLSTDPEKKGPAPFTFTSLNSNPFLELTIKIYKGHHGLTAI